MAQAFPPGLVTLMHLACALGLPQAVHAITRTLNGSTNSASIWSLRDEEGECGLLP